MWQKLGEILNFNNNDQNIKGQVVLVAFPAQQKQWCTEYTTPIIVVTILNQRIPVKQIIWYRSFFNYLNLKPIRNWKMILLIFPLFFWPSYCKEFCCNKPEQNKI